VAFANCNVSDHQLITRYNKLVIGFQKNQFSQPYMNVWIGIEVKVKISFSN